MFVPCLCVRALAVRVWTVCLSAFLLKENTQKDNEMCNRVRVNFAPLVDKARKTKEDKTVWERPLCSFRKKYLKCFGEIPATAALNEWILWWIFFWGGLRAYLRQIMRTAFVLSSHQHGGVVSMTV